MKGFIKHLGKCIPYKHMDNYMKNKDYRKYWTSAFEFIVIDKNNRCLGKITYIPLRGHKIKISMLRDNKTGMIYYG